MTDVDGRTRHYGQFYDVPDCDDAGDDRPLWVVHGNCQAEALRVLLDAGARPYGYRTVRIPPVHELNHDDLVHLRELVSQAAVLISQPVREDYRDLPLGTAQLAGWLPPGAVVLRWPVVRYSGLFPYQVIIRHPVDGSADPPVVPYHDLRTVAAALGSGPLRPLHASSAPASVYREVAAASVAELARREAASADVTVSDVLAAAGTEALHTINHPGNVVLRELAARVLASLGAPGAVADPGRDLLGGIRAPLSQQVLDALGLSGPARPNWLVHGEVVDPEQVHQVQGAFYRADPRWLQAALNRHGELLDQLGLRGG